MKKNSAKFVKVQLIGGVVVAILVVLLLALFDSEEGQDGEALSDSPGHSLGEVAPVPKEVREERSRRSRKDANAKAPSEDNKAGAERLSVEEVFAGFSDYESPTGHFEILQEEPVLHIRVGSAAVHGEPVDIMRENVEREAVTAVLLAFAFSDVPALRVTAQPLRVAPGASKSTLVKKPGASIEVSRRGAERWLASSSGVKSFNDFVLTATALSKQYGEPVDASKYMGLPLAMKFNEVAARPFLYNDQGSPGLKRTLAALQAAK